MSVVRNSIKCKRFKSSIICLSGVTIHLSGVNIHLSGVIIRLSGVIMVLAASYEFDKRLNSEIVERPSDNEEIPEVIT